MELSIFAAKVLAVLYLSVGVAAFGGQMKFKSVMSSFEKSQGLTIITGYLAVFIGMLLIQYHNIWVKDWPVLVTIVGWGALIKGIMYIAFPQSMFDMGRGMVKNEKNWGAVIFIVGLIFGYFGFVA